MAHLEKGKIPIRFRVLKLFSRAGRQRLDFLKQSQKRNLFFSTKNFRGFKKVEIWAKMNAPYSAGGVRDAIRQQVLIRKHGYR